ncbi:MAG: T9SS type A sorting domain-containing protein [Bacteroidia bacterium]
MKKIFTLLLAFTSFSLFAQRYCDIEVKLTSPASGTVIRSGFPVNVTYAFKNLGPDKLMKGDTIYAFLSLDNAVYTNLSFGFVVAADIAKDGAILSFNQGINFNYNAAVPAGNLCASSLLRNSIEGNPQVKDTSLKNNSSCSVVNIRSNDIKIIGEGLAVATHINASPNPANEMVTISYNLVNPSTVLVSLFDINGRQVTASVSDKQGAGENSLQINISQLEAGIYFYEVKIGNDSKRYKLMVN